MKVQTLLKKLEKYYHKLSGFWSWFLGLFNHKRKVNENENSKFEAESESTVEKRGKLLPTFGK